MKKHKNNILLKLMDKNNLSINDMCEKLQLTNIVFKNIMQDKTEPTPEIRNEIRLIFDGQEAFPNLDDSFEGCKKCIHSCKQYYFVNGVMCKNHKKK